MESGKINSTQADSIVGIPAEHRAPGVREKVENHLLDRIEKLGGDAIPELELEKTEEELALIALAEKAVISVMSKHERGKNIPVTLSKVHVLRAGGTEEYTDGRLRGGAHASKYNSVLIDRKESPVDFILVAFHEFFHLKSYQAHQLIKTEDGTLKLDGYRSGFSVVSRDGKQKFFRDMEEAVVGLMSVRFYDEFVKNSPLFQAELERRELENNPVYLSRGKEIDKLKKLVDDLWEKNSHRYDSRREIEDLFIDAQINGRLLAVGRLIDNTYGVGSFRSLGVPDKPDSQVDSQ